MRAGGTKERLLSELRSLVAGSVELRSLAAGSVELRSPAAGSVELRAILYHVMTEMMLRRLQLYVFFGAWFAQARRKLRARRNLICKRTPGQPCLAGDLMN